MRIKIGGTAQIAHGPLFNHFQALPPTSADAWKPHWARMPSCGECATGRLAEYPG